MTAGRGGAGFEINALSRWGDLNADGSMDPDGGATGLTKRRVPGNRRGSCEHAILVRESA